MHIMRDKAILNNFVPYLSTRTLGVKNRTLLKAEMIIYIRSYQSTVLVNFLETHILIFSDPWLLTVLYQLFKFNT